MNSFVDYSNCPAPGPWIGISQCQSGTECTALAESPWETNWTPGSYLQAPDGNWAELAPTEQAYGLCERPAEAYGPQYQDGGACTGSDNAVLERQGFIDFTSGYSPNSRCVWNLVCPDGLATLEILDFRVNGGFP